MQTGNRIVGARLRVVVTPGVGFGPGKAELLQGIKETGSIAAAGRRMGMSYKRAWFLVDVMNGHFEEALVQVTKGGRSGGGAQLTQLGEQMLLAYREMERLTAEAIEPVLRRLRRQARVEVPRGR